MAYKAIVAGASGLIGSNLLNILLQQPEYGSVVILVRKELPVRHEKLTQLMVNFDDLENYRNDVNGHAVFCCLGSTEKKTPDLSLYRKVDHDYPLLLAQLAQKNGVNQYHLVSALGADPDARNFYLKMKGETEADIKKVKPETLHIYRPALLTGDRKEYRLGERIAKAAMKIIDPFLIGSLKNYRSIPAETVARAMYKQSLNNKEGVFIHRSDQIKQLV